MLLSQLSGEIIALIARCNGVSVAILTAFKCGNAALNKKICDNVDVIDLEDYNPASTSRFPKFVSTLRHLRVLRLVRSGPLAPNAILSSELQKLPSSLTELTLSVVNLYDPFLVISDSPARAALDESIFDTSPAAEYWNIATKFPHLLKLALKPCFKSTDDSLVLSALVSVLPPTIEYLELADVRLSSSANLSSLTSLHTLIVKLVSNNFTQWPPHLTRYEVSMKLENRLDQTFYESLPHSLKSLHQFDLESPLELEMMNLPPPALEEIEFIASFDTPLNWLPPKLTKLQKFGRGHQSWK